MQPLATRATGLKFNHLIYHLFTTMNPSEGSTAPPADHRRFFCADRPNSELNQRYKLVGKLGEGRRSCVWLAEDI